MGNLANSVEKIQEQKEAMLTGNSWVSLKGSDRERYIELCRLQRKAIRKELSTKEIIDVLDKR